MPGKCACNLRAFQCLTFHARAINSADLAFSSIDKRRVLLIVLESQSVGAIGKDKTIRGMYLFQKKKKATKKKNRVWISQ
jgi:hypothetical protein